MNAAPWLHNVASHKPASWQGLWTFVFSLLLAADGEWVQLVHFCVCRVCFVLISFVQFRLNL